MIIKNIIYYFKKRLNLSLFIFQALQLFEAISNYSLYFILALAPAWATWRQVPKFPIRLYLNQYGCAKTAQYKELLYHL